MTSDTSSAASTHTPAPSNYRQALRLHVVQEGSGPVVVLSHALGCDLHMWDGVAARLKDRFTVLRYDHRGHGQSETPVGPYTMGMLADDAAQVIAQHANGRAHVVGLSMGGMMAQALAAMHPQLVSSIVVANAACHYDDAARAMWQARIRTVRDKGMAAITEASMLRWFSARFRHDLEGDGARRVAQSQAQLEQTDASGYAASCEAVCHIDLRHSNTTIACPALVIAGLQDEATTLAHSQAIANAITGSQLRTLDTAHISAVEQPEAFADLLINFLDGLAQPLGGSSRKPQHAAPRR